MNVLLGVLLLLMSVVILVSATVRKAEAQEYVWALMFGEWGVMVVVLELIPEGLPRVITAWAFVLALAATAVLWFKLFRESRKRRRW